MNIRRIIMFFGIVILFTSCEKIDPNKQIDEGEFKNNIYSSKEIGWTIKIPEKWKIISRKQNEANEKRGLEAINKTIEGEIDASKLKNLIGFKKNRFNLFQSTSEPFKLEYEGEWEGNNIEIKKMLYRTYLSQGIKADSTITKIINIDGFDFYSYEFTIRSPKGDVILRQLMYSRLINGFDFGVNINYNNESDKKEMLNVWLNSTFKK